AALPAAALTEADFGPIVTFGNEGDYPAIASGPADDTSLVVYRANDDSAIDPEIFGQFVDNELELIGSPFLVSNTTDGYSGNPPTAEWNSDRQEWLVVWEESNNDLGSDVVAGRIVRPGVGSVGSQLIIADGHAGSDFGDMELAYSAYAANQDLYLVAFKATVQVEQGPSCQAAFGVFVNSDGTVPTTEATILSTPDAVSCEEQIDNGANVDYSPASSRWLVGWGYQSGDTGTALVENVAGVVTIDGGQVLVGSNNNVVHPSIDHDSTRDRFLVGWHYQDGTFAQIFGALVDNAGAQIGTAFAVTPEDARGNQRAPRMIYDPAADQFRAVNHNTGTRDTVAFVGYWELLGSTGATAAAAQVLSDPSLDSARPDITIAGECVLVV
ncbi:MAG: hypothetical protein Q7J04_00925, partial [Microcella sp.]|nr:hypothetical protein [Microcella sp.]